MPNNRKHIDLHKHLDLPSIKESVSLQPNQFSLLNSLQLDSSFNKLNNNGLLDLLAQVAPPPTEAALSQHRLFRAIEDAQRRFAERNSSSYSPSAACQ